VNKAELLRLLASSNRSIGEVRDRVPAVFTLLQGLALAEARRQLLAGFEDAPADLKARVTAASLRVMFRRFPMATPPLIFFPPVTEVHRARTTSVNSMMF